MDLNNDLQQQMRQSGRKLAFSINYSQCLSPGGITSEQRFTTVRLEKPLAKGKKTEAGEATSKTNAHSVLIKVFMTGDSGNTTAFVAPNQKDLKKFLIAP